MKYAWTVTSGAKQTKYVFSMFALHGSLECLNSLGLSDAYMRQ